MPSLRQRVSTYFRQLSFIAEPTREDARFASTLSPRNTVGDGCFITKYLEGQMNGTNSNGTTTLTEIMDGKEPNDLPDLSLRAYDTGLHTVIAACTGPGEGLTAVKRSRAHLTLDDDIDFIDTTDENPDERKSVPKPELSFRTRYQQQFRNRVPTNSNKTAEIADQNANKPIEVVTSTNGGRPRKLSKTELPANKEETTTTTTTKIHQLKTEPNAVGTVNVIVSMIKTTRVTSDPNKPKPDNVNLVLSRPLSDNYNKNVEILKENISPNDNVTNSNNRHSSDNKDFIPNDLMTASTILNCNSIASPDEYAGISNWKMDNENAYGMSVSLYEKNYLTQESTGNPVADCYGLVMRGNSVAMALADGVNWGEGACLAARSAVQGSLDYLNKAVFGQVAGSMAKSTREIFVSLLRSFWSAHACILETGGALSTLTVAVILPLSGPRHTGKSVVCCCNVGDSLGYVYSKTHGVREFTQGSHDVNSMRDMRDALGALGPVDGNNPELGNLTLSMTVVEAGDIVFLTSDGISDNFDPVVGKFAEPLVVDPLPKTETQPQTTAQQQTQKQGLAPKRQNKSTSSMHGTDTKKSNVNFQLQRSETQPIRPARNSKKNISMTSPKATQPQSQSQSQSQSRPKFLRSHTVIESSRNRLNKASTLRYPVSAAGLPLVTGAQRHALTLLRLEDLLSYGINGQLQPCVSARKLCHLLVDFAKMITSAKRKMLEQRELFYKVATVVAPPDPETGTSSGVIKKEIEMNRLQQRAARKKVVDGQIFPLLPGKLDHATVVAVRVPSITESSNFVETDF